MAELDAFLSRWNNKNLAMQEFCGEAMAYCPWFVEKSIIAFGSKLLEIQQTCRRIDFLYSRPKIPPKYKRLINSKNCQIKFSVRNRIVFIESENLCQNINIMLLRNIDNISDNYSIRIYDNEKREIPEYLNKNWKFFKKPVFDSIVGETITVNSETFDNVINESNLFWNFGIHENKVRIAKNSEGFLDQLTTIKVINLVTYTSNLLGFQLTGG